MNMPWFRFYADVLNDPKVQSLDPQTFKMWVNILCIASQNEGYVPVSRNVSWALRETEETFHRVSQALLDAGLLDKSDRKNSSFKIHSWEKRQYKSDTSTERVKRFRNGKRNVTETAPDTDTDTDIVVVDARGVKKQISILVGAEDDPRWYGNLQRIDQWLANGWDPELDIYPTVKFVMSKRTSPPQSAKYFEQAIADAHAKRTNPSPLPKGNPNNGTHQSTREQRINDALERAWTDTEYNTEPGQETPSLDHSQTKLLDVQPVREITRRP